jgi:hypothetical protein
VDNAVFRLVRVRPLHILAVHRVPHRSLLDRLGGAETVTEGENGKLIFSTTVIPLWRTSWEAVEE